MQLLRKCAALMVAGIAMLGASTTARASSHSDAPLIKQDPSANLTDVFTFVGTNQMGTKVLNVVINVHPFCEPGDGAIYDRFSDDALYSIHITDPKTGATKYRYDFRFSPVDEGYKNVNTILSYGLGTEVGPINHVGDARQNFTQTYTVTRVQGSHVNDLTGGATLTCPPPNVGQNTTPFYNDSTGRAVSGAATYAALDRYTSEASYVLPGGETVFAGPRDDGFFADAPGVFDLINSRILKSDHMGVDGFKGYNVLTYAIQIPLSKLTNVPNFPSVGVFASVSRPHTRLLFAGDPTNRNLNPKEWIQVNRLANPLFNEVLVATKDKDNYNFDDPTNDVAKYSQYASTPEIAHLLNVIYHVNAVETGRTDLVGIYIPDVIRVDTSTPPVPLPGQANFNRLSVFGGDTVTNAGGQTVASGWPNGRRIGDDVVDIALTAVLSGPSFSPIRPLGDNVDSNDQPFNQVFPFEATPNSGTFNRKDPGD